MMTKDNAEPPAAFEGERIAKRLARAGVCSRRDAERWIAEGRVKVNGKVLDSPALNVKPGDRILVDNQLVPDAEPTRVWRYHKPEGLVTSARDEKGRDTVFDKLPPELPRVVSVGRLDLTSEGLLLLTNDGELARHLELPATGWVRRYRVRVFGAPSAEMLATLKRGVTVDGVTYGPIEAEMERQVGSNAWLIVGLREGKNREVRKVMEYLGLPVSRLIRVAYGPFQLGKLERGGVEEVPRRVLKDQLPGFFADEAKEGGAAAARLAPRLTLRFDKLPKPKAPTEAGGENAGGKPARKPRAAHAPAAYLVEEQRAAKPTRARPDARKAEAPKRGPGSGTGSGAGGGRAGGPRADRRR